MQRDGTFHIAGRRRLTYKSGVGTSGSEKCHLHEGRPRQTSRRENLHIVRNARVRQTAFVSRHPGTCNTCVFSNHTMPPIDASVWSGAAHEETGLQRNGTRSSLATNPDSILAVMTIVFVCGDPVVNVSILPLLCSDITLPHLV
ncbi:uncharacterized protein TNCV_1622451 [Trichonephila clavipes]|nr:uncharacterized protein TNCV_1622451 [Trichonephila clavipes]